MKGWLIFFQIHAVHAAAAFGEKQAQASKKRSRASIRIGCDRVHAK